jgi:hypothetical protein
MNTRKTKGRFLHKLDEESMVVLEPVLVDVIVYPQEVHVAAVVVVVAASSPAAHGGILRPAGGAGGGTGGPRAAAMAASERRRVLARPVAV